MDEVDYRQKDLIREVLQARNVSGLMQLVPSLDEEAAEYYVNLWQNNYSETMSRIRNNQDTSVQETENQNILFDLLDKSHLSGYHR